MKQPNGKRRGNLVESPEAFERSSIAVRGVRVVRVVRGVRGVRGVCKNASV